MIELVLAVIIVIVTSAMCSLFEAALYSTPTSHIELMVESGSRAGKVMKKLRDNIDAPITAILSLNTISNTAGAAIAGAIAARVLGQGNVVFFSIVFTFSILFLSEVMPKTLGVLYNRTLAPLIAWPIQALVWVFVPIVWLVGQGTKLLGQSDDQGISPDELVVMTRLARRAGSINEDESKVIQNILAVREKVVEDVMTPRTVLFSLDNKITVAKAAEDKRVYSHARIPVYNGDHEDIVGIAYRRDILAVLAEKGEDVPLLRIAKPVHFVLETANLDKVMKLFLERQEHLFVVIDEFGGLAGVISLEDILEEILGEEIVDEFDEVADLRALAHQRRDDLLKSNASPPKHPSV